MYDKKLLHEYIAVKLSSLNFYIWFETKKITVENGIFTGDEGWGKDGSFTSLQCRVADIDGYLYSSMPQYR